MHCSDLFLPILQWKMLALCTLKVNYIYNTYKYPINIYSVGTAEYLGTVGIYLSQALQKIAFLDMYKLPFLVIFFPIFSDMECFVTGSQPT